VLSIKFHASKCCLETWSRSWTIAQQLHIRNTITGIYVYINYSMDINFSRHFYSSCTTLIARLYCLCHILRDEKQSQLQMQKIECKDCLLLGKKTCMSTGFYSTFNLFLLCAIKESYCFWWKARHIHGWWHLALGKGISYNILQ